MKKWINENGGPLIVAAVLVGIAIGGYTYLGHISDGISGNRNEIRESWGTTSRKRKPNCETSNAKLGKSCGARFARIATPSTLCAWR